MNVSIRSHVMSLRKLTATLWLALAVLPFVFADESSGAALGDWRHALYCRRPEGNVRLVTRWYPSHGVHLAVVERRTGRAIALQLNREKLTPYDPLHGQTAPLAFETRFLHSRHLTEPRGRVETVVKLRENEWTFYVDGELTAMMPAPFQPPADIYLPVDDRALPGEDPVFRPVPREQFATDFMIEEGAPNQLYPWRIESGDWRIHTIMEDALERPESNLDRMERVPLTADKSPNFYSLKGGGIAEESGEPMDAVITTGYDFFSDYEYAAAMQVNEGEVGLVFYHVGEGTDNYYAFTLYMGDGGQSDRFLRLWRVKNGERRELGRARVPLFKDQWYQPRVLLHTDEIVCFLDDIEVLRVREHLPIGGKIGLYARARSEIRFDDVTLNAYQRLPVRNVGEIRYQTLYHDGAFYRKRSFWRRGTPVEQTRLEPARRPSAQTLVLGRAHNRGTVMSAVFTPDDERWTLGLVCGFRHPDEPYFRFLVTRQDGREAYRLERLVQGREHFVDHWEQRAPGARPDGTVTLMADATEPGTLRLLKDGRTVLIIPLDGSLEGAAGLYVGGGTGVTISDLTYDFKRERFLEKENKNPVFQEDSFMRHWAAPEGQWIAGEDDTLWFKGDFFADFSVLLPCIDGSDFHAFVPEAAVDGPVRLAVDGSTLRLNVADHGEAEPAVYEHTLVPPEGKDVGGMQYALHREGYWIWITIDEQTVMRHRIARDMEGTRARVKGMTLSHLARSRVTRSNVISDYFSESPYRWTVNGGNWQIINRFQCTPSWSHMIGESADSMAALWYKRIFSGDLTLEFYAGTRHGWYERAGDLNCTVMAETTSPNSGYTVTCTEFDHNLSQNWSTLYRNGEVVDRSDKYLVPRRRAGMVRKFLNPLVSQGRPIHGAWYYIKLRRIGDKLEYYFDNELVFALEDEAAIHEGLVGIWTFMHSMTLAQIKIAFQDSRPRPFPVERVPISPLTPGGEDKADTPQWALLQDGWPVDSLDPAYWSSEDKVGQATRTHFKMNANAVRLTNQLGSGHMPLQADLPLIPLHRLAGWRFLLKRSPGTRFNLYYTIGSVDGRGAFKPMEACFQQLSGAGFSDGEFMRTGRSHVNACDTVHLSGGDWEQVTAWIPSRIRSGSDEKRGLMVRLDGFGNRQPSPIMCGLGGNEPGDAYAIRQLTPVVYGYPHLTVGESGEPLRFALRDRPSGRLFGEALGADAPAELNRLIEAVSRPGLNSAWVRVFDRQGQSFYHELAWIEPPETLPVHLAWDPERAATLRVTHGADYPDPRFADVSVTAGAATLPLEAVGNQEVRLARLPREQSEIEESIPVEVSQGTQTLRRDLSWRDRPVNDAPVLIDIEGLGSALATFEGNSSGPLQFTQDGRMRMLNDDPRQGRFVEIRNSALNQRMSASFTSPFSMAEYPIMQLRYRAFDMTRLSVAFKNSHYARLNDDYSAAVSVRLAHDLKLDENWHTWTGFVADAFTSQPYSADRFLPRAFAIRSCGSPDQTGRYSRWHIDDLVFGPAVAKAAQLAWIPRFFDHDGIARVHTAVAVGETPYAERDHGRKRSLEWIPVEPGQALDLSLDDLENGVHHVLLKATDRRGRESRVYDIPFLFDTRALDVKAGIGSYTDPASNGTQLTVTMNNHGASPWAIEKATFHIAGEETSLPSWTNLFVHAAQAEKLVLNHPFLFRKHLDNAKDGDTFEFAIDNIVDGAGNASPRLTVPITVDHGSDRTGPAWYYVKPGESVHWWWNWDGYRSTTAALSPGQHNRVDVIHKVGESPYLQHQTYRHIGDLTRSVSWKPAGHPWISFRANQPAYHPKRGVNFQLVLTTTDKRTYTLSLTEPGKGGSELNRDQTIEWKRGQWQRLSFNVAAMLEKAGVSPRVIGQTTINTINFQRRGTRHQEPLYLDDLFIHGVPASADKPDPFTVNAYDASGVSAMRIECVDAAEKILWSEELEYGAIDLNQLRKRIDGMAWLRCRAKDHAGNLSVPFWLPLAAN